MERYSIQIPCFTEGADVAQPTGRKRRKPSARSTPGKSPRTAGKVGVAPAAGTDALVSQPSAPAFTALQPRPSPEPAEAETPALEQVAPHRVTPAQPAARHPVTPEEPVAASQPTQPTLSADPDLGADPDADLFDEPDALASTARGPSSAEPAVATDPSLSSIPTLQLQFSAAEAKFLLRSRLNTLLLAGGPVPAGTERHALAERLRALCADENQLVIEPVDGAFIVHLIDEQGSVIARSNPVADAALARATRRLIPLQAKNARTVVLDEPSETDSRTAAGAFAD